MKEIQPFIPHFIQEQYIARRFTGNIEGSVFFVDISGFTLMTQQLMNKGQKEGAEVLSNILNTIFEVMVSEVYYAQGFITHFAGDAFTAIFPTKKFPTPKHSALTALQCAQNIQLFFLQNGVQRSKFGKFDLQVKIGLSFGQIDWGIVGDEHIMGLQASKFYFRGQAIDEATLVEQQADKGETLLSQNFKTILKEVPLKGNYLSDNIFHFESFEAYGKTPLYRSQAPELPQIQPTILNLFIPSEVIALREKGEFRNVISIFISFKGIETHEQLNIFASIVLKHIIRYKGALKEIDFGDKGATMVGFFGAPVAYENNLARALYFAEEVANEITESSALKTLRFRMGITSGKVYAGIIGGSYRCEYTCIGDIVNMASRIMMQAPWQQIWVNNNIATDANFTFQKKGKFYYKGFVTPVETYEFSGRAKKKNVDQNNVPIIGHETTLAELQKQITPIFEGKTAGIIYIFGEAGIGKTRLAHALKEKTISKTTWLHITADQILQKPFQPFKDMLIAHFKFPRLKNTLAQKSYFKVAFQSLIVKLNHNMAFLRTKGTSQKKLLRIFKDALNELRRTEPILASQVGIVYEDNLLEHLDAKGKYENTISAIQNFLKVLSLLNPLVIHLEDSQWLDPDSIALLQKLCNHLTDYPIAILSTARYKDDGTQALLPLKDFPFHTIELDYLPPHQVKALAEVRLNSYNENPISLSDSFLEVLVERSKGNPFFVEQLLQFFGENQWLQNRFGKWQLTQHVDSIPDSIQALLMARIDRLSKQIKQVVKVAAVIGREFDTQLLSMLLNRNVLPEMKVAETEQVWNLQRDTKGIFKHTLLRDMAYDMQLKAQLRQLHQLTAAAMENIFLKNIEEKYADIAFHYEKAETTIKAIEYLEKAGNYAKDNFQNQQALDLFERLLKQLRKLNDDDFIWKILLEKASVLRTIGKWDAAKTTYQTAMELAKTLQNKAYQTEVLYSLARIYSLQGKYQESLDYYQRCLEEYESSNDKKQIANTVGYMGVIYINLSQNDTAAKCFQKQISLASELGDQKNHATALGNLGSLFNQIGKYQAAVDCYQKSYQLFEKINYPQNAAMNLANMGTIATIQDDYDAAMSYYQQSLQSFEKIGYQHGTAYTVVNIGYTFMQKGLYEEALSYFDKSLLLSLEMKDRRLQAFAEGNMGKVYYQQHIYEKALTYLEKAIEGHEQIGFKHSLPDWYWSKALCLYELIEYSKALEWTTKSIEVSQAIARTDMLFNAKLLQGKLQYKVGEKKAAIAQLKALLENNAEDENKAAVHFELWQIYREEINRQKKASKAKIASEAFEEVSKKDTLLEMEKNHHQEALQLFQKLFATKPKKEFESKIALLIKQYNG